MRKKVIIEYRFYSKWDLKRFEIFRGIEKEGYLVADIF